MTEPESNVRLYEYSGVLYSGSYTGWMIVASRNELRALGHRLIEASDRDGEAYTKEWPPVVLRQKAIGPYSNEGRFESSFHFEGTLPSESVVPRRRKFPGQVLSLVILALAILGAARALEIIGKFSG